MVIINRSFLCAAFAAVFDCDVEARSLVHDCWLIPGSIGDLL